MYYLCTRINFNTFQKMKKMFLIALMGVATLVSCKKEDAKTTEENATLEGVWYLHQLSAAGQGLAEADACQKRSTFEIKANEIVLTNYNDEGAGCEITEKETYSYRKEGNKLLLENANIADYTYSISGKTLTLEYTPFSFAGTSTTIKVIYRK